MSNPLESFHEMKKVPENKKIENVSNTESHYNEVDSATEIFIKEYKKDLESAKDDTEKENLKLKLVNKINSLEEDRDLLWNGLDNNVGSPEPEVELDNDFADQITTNINKLRELL